jgi:hypothetical protein
VCFQAGCALFRLQILNPVYIPYQVFAAYQLSRPVLVCKSVPMVDRPYFAIRMWLVATPFWLCCSYILFKTYNQRYPLLWGFDGCVISRCSGADWALLPCYNGYVTHLRRMDCDRNLALSSLLHPLPLISTESLDALRQKYTLSWVLFTW